MLLGAGWAFWAFAIGAPIGYELVVAALEARAANPTRADAWHALLITSVLRRGGRAIAFAFGLLAGHLFLC